MTSGIAEPAISTRVDTGVLDDVAPIAFLSDEDLVGRPAYSNPGWSTLEPPTQRPVTIQLPASDSPKLQRSLALLVERFRGVDALEADWDSYQSPTITTEILVTSLRICLELLAHGEAVPLVVPMSGGGIQLEWPSSEAELEVAISNPSSVELTYANRDGDDVDVSADSLDAASLIRSLLKTA